MILNKKPPADYKRPLFRNRRRILKVIKVNENSPVMKVESNRTPEEWQEILRQAKENRPSWDG